LRGLGLPAPPRLRSGQALMVAARFRPCGAGHLCPSACICGLSVVVSVGEIANPLFSFPLSHARGDGNSAAGTVENSPRREPWGNKPQHIPGFRFISSPGRGGRIPDAWCQSLSPLPGLNKIMEVGVVIPFPRLAPWAIVYRPWRGWPSVSICVHLPAGRQVCG